MGPGHEQNLTAAIMIGALINAIGRLNRSQAVGPDNITDELLMTDKARIAPLIPDILHAGKYNNGIGIERLQRIVTFLWKSIDPLSMGSNRPITLRNMIYNIWACVFSKRHTPRLPLLTDESQSE